MKKGLLLLLFVILLKTNVFAGNMDSSSGVYVYRSGVFDGHNLERSFFLFSDIVFDQYHNGDIFLYRSKATITGVFEGDIFCFFSRAEIDGVHSRLIVDLSSPLFLIPLKLMICLIIFSSKRSFFEQGSVAVLHSPAKVARNGLLVYFICISLVCMFLISVIGFPLSLLVLVVTYILIVLGEISLAIVMGYFCTDIVGGYICKLFSLKKGKRTFSYANMLVGVIIIETVGYIPGVGAAVKYVLLPILCTGILSCCIINGYIRKIFYQLPYGTRAQGQGCDPKIRERLLNGMKEGSRHEDEE